MRACQQSICDYLEEIACSRSKTPALHYDYTSDSKDELEEIILKVRQAPGYLFTDSDDFSTQYGNDNQYLMY